MRCRLPTLMLGTGKPGHDMSSWFSTHAFQRLCFNNGVPRRPETQGPRRPPENARSASSILHNLLPQRGNGNGRQHFRDPALAWSARRSRFLPPVTRLSRSAGDLFEPRGPQTQSAFPDAAVQPYQLRQAKRGPVFLFNWDSEIATTTTR